MCMFLSYKHMEIEMEQETNHETLSSSNNLLQWSQWQLLDSLLPTGGFAHSYGLEAAIQSHLVSDHDDLKSYIIQILDNTGSLLLPFVYTATKYPTVETWSKLDKRLEATLTNEISRKASTSQGSALLRYCSKGVHVYDNERCCLSCDETEFGGAHWRFGVAA
ncbi:urease accessory protein F isoform X5 [Asparagus officinalis]|uniref:urease accessory protein F isoform X5 n=1 Tax=Asparagus officinalis TaxID=4686 RepID=UPI00098E7943|nr:urease accessory protein F isoform X5 [Asparagus officinalis]